MSLSPDMIHAVQCIYGSAADPLCIVDQKLCILWQPDERASELLPLLAAALQTSCGLPLLPNNDLIYLRDSTGLLQCHIEMLPNMEEAAYLLRFTRCDGSAMGQHTACAALSACAEEIRLTVSDLLQSLADVYGMLRRSQCPESSAEAADRMLAACYRLPNQSLRCAEYAWYETSEAAPPVSYAVVDLARMTMQIAETLRTIVEDVLVIDDHDIAYGMTVCTDAERLHFVLLAIFLMAQNGCTVDTVIRIRTERRGDMAVVCMESERVSDRSVPRLHKALALPTDATAVSAEALVRRFCRQFGGTLQCCETERGCCVSLQLPFADLPAGFVFEAPRPTLPPGRYSSYYVMLSSVIDFRCEDTD